MDAPDGFAHVWPIYCPCPSECNRSGQLHKKNTCGEAMVWLDNHLRCGKGHIEVNRDDAEIRELVVGSNWYDMLVDKSTWEPDASHVTDQDDIAAGIEFLDAPGRRPWPKSIPAPGRHHRDAPRRSRTPPRRRGNGKGGGCGKGGGGRDDSIVNIGSQIATAIGDALRSTAVVPTSRPEPSSASSSNGNHALRQRINEASSIIADAAGAAREMASVAQKAARACEYEGQKLDLLKQRLLEVMP